MLEKLIGYQIVEMDDFKIIVKKDNNTYCIEIDDDSGSCCGYNEITTELLYTPNGDTNPIITNISIEDNNEYNADSATITFFGEYAPIAKLNSYSSSGSGWVYGATVTLSCKLLDIDEIITSY